MIKITISKEISSSIGYTIIPLLLTILETETLFEYVSRYIHIPESYKILLEQIENNMKHNNLNMANFTIENKHNVSSGSRDINIKTINKTIKKINKKKDKSKRIKSLKISKSLNISKSIKPLSKIHQIFIITINNRTYSNSKYDEFIELARISGNTIFNTLK